MAVQRDPLADVDELMQRVREDVARRRASAVAGVATAPSDTSSPSDGEHSNYTLPPLPEFSVEPAFELKSDGYSVADFTRFHHADFIKAAFKGILGRDPEPDALQHFLLRLSLGDSKALVLGLIRFSPEGRSRGVRIRGLTPRYAAERACGIPVLGYLFRLVLSLLRLPRILRHMRQLESYTIAQLAASKEHSSSVDRALHGALGRWISVHRETSDRMDDAIGRLATATDSLPAWKVSTDLRLTKALQVQAALQEAHQVLSESVTEMHSERAAERAAAVAELERVERERSQKLQDQEIDARDLDEFYAAFENVFRGERQDVKQRVAVHLQRLLDAGIGTSDMPVVDVGCGRGEWLELLKEHGLQARGIDVNRLTVENCREAGLDVIEGNAIEYLRGLPDESAGALTAFHVVEHLSFSDLITLLREAGRVLRPGGIAIFETPNPENVLVGSNTFYLDPTHRNPIPPATLQFVASRMGLSETSIVFLHPYPEGERISTNDPALGEFVNTRFFGPRDYALIARKR